MFNIVTKKSLEKIDWDTKDKLTTVMAKKMLELFKKRKEYYYDDDYILEKIIKKAKDRAADTLASEIVNSVSKEHKDKLIKEVYNDNTINDLIREKLRNQLDSNVEIY
jgi:hypothetical protein